MTHRFYVTQLSESAGSRIEVDGSEAHHLLNVLRLKPGAEIELFDGTGLIADAEVVECGRKSAIANVASCRRVAAPRPTITLATAIPKGDRLRWLIEKATEVGVDRILPVNTARSVVDPRNSKLAKLRLTSVSAAKQCGRVTLPTIEQPIGWDQLLQEECRSDRWIVVADPGGLRLADVLASRTLAAASNPTSGVSSTDILQETTPRTNSSLHVRESDQRESHERESGNREEWRDVLVVVGPEGGLTEDEVGALVARDATRVGLGTTILRIETAGILLVGALSALRSPS